MRAAAALFHQQPAFCHKYSWLLRFIHQFVMHWLLLVLIIQGSGSALFQNLLSLLLYARADLLLVLNQVAAFNIQEVYTFLIGPHGALSRVFCSIESKFEIHDRAANFSE
jgi:hypothetical protein